MGVEFSANLIVGVEVNAHDIFKQEVKEIPVDCGHTPLDGAKFCGQCGSRLIKTIYCLMPRKPFGSLLPKSSYENYSLLKEINFNKISNKFQDSKHVLVTEYEETSKGIFGISIADVGISSAFSAEKLQFENIRNARNYLMSLFEKSPLQESINVFIVPRVY